MTVPEDNPLVGIWVMDQDSQIVELLFRTDGRYQQETRTSSGETVHYLSERGWYAIEEHMLILAPYQYADDPAGKRYYSVQLVGPSLTIVAVSTEATYEYHFKPDSRADVIQRQAVDRNLIGTWWQPFPYSGHEQYTFRPSGYYFFETVDEASEPPIQYVRGRYEHDGDRSIIKPYGGVEATYELDFFGDTLTLILVDQYRRESSTYLYRPGSRESVQAKADEAAAFLSQDNWHVGVWEIREVMHTMDLTIRPDGRFIVRQETEYARGLVRGRYAIEDRRIRAFPYPGQDIYMQNNPEYGKYEWTRELDYYDGELQLIDLRYSQAVTLAHERPDSAVVVAQKTAEAHAERARQGWYVGIWEVNDPVGWMEFTFRPDGRYIGQAGTQGVAGEVERGRYLVSDEKLTLDPYGGLRQGRRGFELDLYDGDLYLVGDPSRLVVARKVDDSEATVIERTRDPAAMKGERGSILGLWTANMPGQSDELVFRPDGEFRLKRCSHNGVSHDYGLYSADMAARSAVYDSRFVVVETLELDFYGHTLTMFGGLGAPRTYTVNLGQVDAAIAASLAADAEEAAVDALWLARVPVGPRDPGWVQVPTGTIPADPIPAHVFEGATVFSNFQFYRRLISGFVYFYESGTIYSLPVVNTREFYFFLSGRTLVRFTNYRASPRYPNTVVDVSDTWGAYRIEPRPTQNDILHRFADNVLFIESDTGELTEMTLEDGRRNLFLDKDYQLLSEWASEQKTIPCDLPPDPDPSLMNTGLSLSSTLPPDEVPAS